LSFAAVVAAIVVALTTSMAQGRVDPGTQQLMGAQLSETTDAKATGGGTVTVPVGFGGTAVASFGLNAKRPTGFTNGLAQGRINYNKHAQVADRHVNVPVSYMQAEISTTPTPNGTGGRAAVVGQCGGAGSECRAGDQSVVVYVEDRSDSGGGNDIFRIFFCAVASPDLTTFDGTTPPVGCAAPEGGTIRTGNIQIRPGGTGASGVAPTAARAPLRLP
jgi:hypothetical protein